MTNSCQRFALLAACLVSVFAGCNSSSNSTTVLPPRPGPSSSVDSQVYSLYAGATPGLQQYGLNILDGSLSFKGDLSFSINSAPSLVAAASGGGMLFALSPYLYNPYVYSINSEGFLNNVGPQNVDGNFGAVSAAVSPNGAFLYAASQASNIGVSSPAQLISYAVSNGLVAVGSPITYGVDVIPNQVIVHPSGRWVYLAADGGQILQYSVNVDGSLSAGPQIVTGSGARSLTFAPSGNFLYVVNKTAGTLSVFQVASAGTLSALGGPVSLAQGLTPEAIAIAPNGNTLYVAVNFVSFTNRSLESLAINLDGTLSGASSRATLSYDEIDSAAIPSMVVDPTGQFLYVATSQGIVLEQVNSSSGARIADPVLIAPSNQAINSIAIVRH